MQKSDIQYLERLLFRRPVSVVPASWHNNFACYHSEGGQPPPAIYKPSNLIIQQSLPSHYNARLVIDMLFASRFKSHQFLHAAFPSTTCTRLFIICLLDLALLIFNLEKCMGLILKVFWLATHI